MAFEFQIGTPVQRELRRIAVERTDKAIRTIEGVEHAQIARAVHGARRRCKELRALLRLVRPGFKGYQRENVMIRDAARSLADLRDARTVLDAFDRLLLDCKLEPDRFEGIREGLAKEHATQAQSSSASLEEFLRVMHGVRARAEKWALKDSQFEALRGGLEATYAKCQRTLADAKREPSIEALHEWRKYVKYNRAHLRLLRELWPPIIEPMRQEAKLLSDLLGQDHDLAVLAEALKLQRQAHDDQASTSTELLAQITHRRLELREHAFGIGPRLYAHKPRAYGRFARDLWRLA